MEYSDKEEVVIKVFIVVIVNFNYFIITIRMMNLKCLLDLLIMFINSVMFNSSSSSSIKDFVVDCFGS